VGAISLLYLLLRRGAASRVASLFFLVPPATAPIAWPLLGERLGPWGLTGMKLAAGGVALVNRPQSEAAGACGRQEGPS
jgi:drug/metabolite transporter (DMT)-like permease